jgi:nitroreductase
MNEVLNVIKSRRSIRAYKSEQIDETALKEILEAGIYAPTACNEQPWHFTVIQNAELLDQINVKSKAYMASSDVAWMKSMAEDPDFAVTYHAPTVVVVSGRRESTAWQTDCAAAIQNMLLAAESLGIGSVWLGLSRPALKDESIVGRLGIPAGYEPFYCVSLGYPAAAHPQAPGRNQNVFNFIK